MIDLIIFAVTCMFIAWLVSVPIILIQHWRDGATLRKYRRDYYRQVNEARRAAKAGRNNGS